MLARQSRRGAALLQRAASLARAFSDVPGGIRDEQRDLDAPVVFSRKPGSKELRYYVLKDEKEGGLSMLESAVYRTPMLGPTGALRLHERIPPPGVCASLLRKAVQDPGLAEKAAEIAEALMLQGTRLEASTMRAIVDSLAKADALPEALPMVDAWLQQQEEALQDDANTRVPLQLLTTLMDTAARTENTHVILQVLTRMARIGVLPSPQSLTTLLQCFMRLGQVQVAHQVLDWMRRNNLEPNIYSYTALLALPRNMSESAAPELLRQAQAAYQKMQDDGVQPNARFYTEYLRVCGRVGDLQAAQEAWQDARRLGVQSDVILFTAMIDACAKCRDPQAALQVFGEMRQSGVRPDVVAYTSLLSALQGTPQAVVDARELWASMRADGVAPSGMAVAAYLDILLTEGEIDQALQLLADSQASRPAVSSRLRVQRGAAQAGRRAAAPGRTKWQLKAQRLLEDSGLLEEGQEGEELLAAAAAPAAPPTAGATAAAEAAEAEAAEAGAEGAAGAAGAAEAAEAEEAPPEGEPIDLPRLYEHFMFAMAHKGQFAVVEQMARHMRSRDLRHTAGTASALLTAQALQHGHTTAKWLLQPPGTAGGKPGVDGGGSGGGSSGGSGDSRDVWVPTPLVDVCLLGRGNPKEVAERLIANDSTRKAQQGWRPDASACNVVLAGLAVRGSTQEAFQLFEHMKQQQQEQQQQRAAAAAERAAAAGGTAGGAAARRLRMPWRQVAPNQWTYSLLLFAALNAPKEQQLELTLRVLQEAREPGAARGSGSGGGTALLRFVDWWEGRHATLYMVQEPDSPEPVQIDLDDPFDADKFVPGARLRVIGTRKLPPGQEKEKHRRFKAKRVQVLGGGSGSGGGSSGGNDPLLLSSSGSSVGNKKVQPVAATAGTVQQLPVRLALMKLLVIPIKVNAYLADRTTLNPACPKSGQVYMYTDDAGKNVYSPWTLEGLATETVSRDQLRATVFGPNTKGESVASMFRDCSYQQTKVAAEAAKGGSKVMNYIALPCTGSVNGIAMQWNSCDADDWVAAASALAQQQLAAQGDSLTNYPYQVFLLPNRPADCYWGALAWASGQSVAVQALGDVALAPFVYVHELGHTLGLEHAGKGDNVYGDDTATMGGFPPGGGLSDGGTDRCHNAPQSWQLGWTDAVRLDATTLKAGASRAVDIYLPTQSAPSSGVPQVLRVVPNWLTSTAGLRIWASYRTREGGDNDMGATLTGKVHIYTGSIDGANDWIVTNWEASLTLGGAAWVHPPSGLQIQFASLSGKTARLRVRR
ncbi:hypothetical protein C2E21_5247 [Chlorella sorokiniana]|uniref:Peptidase M11 gametolysin domain-containing protein n=1 Tax=Chlorella sorokiniana TaxID=3076 RepID=A0A2P6TPF2_CHLSO|nr:hypothetical protein C2E21_5247 [Chlorella sorokiniana]|eukprot:PRW55912.1 hypothetical protein C2E21_5247 [Chlorella sorokiniana]